MIEGGCKEVDGGQPEAKKMTKCLRTQGPFGTDDLILATQKVGEEIHLGAPREAPQPVFDASVNKHRSGRDSPRGMPT